MILENMPHLRIETNVKSRDIGDMQKCVEEFQEEFQKIIGKPDQYVAVTLIPDVAMTMGKDANVPTAQATLTSIGKLGIEENKNISAGLFPIINNKLKVESDKCYIIFNDVKTSDVGYKGTTFHEILGK